MMDTTRRFAACLLLLLPNFISPAIGAQRGFVHTAGPALLTASGQTLMLRGINLGNWLVPEGYMFHFDQGPQSPQEIEELVYELIGPERAAAFWQRWRERYITEADIDLLKKNGFNSIRVPLHWKFFDSANSDGFRILDRLVEWARKDGIYVILDMHCAPGGQTGTNIDDSSGYPWLYSSPEAQAHTVAIWRRIAAHYRNEPTILGYDLLNEPIPHYPRLEQFNKDLEPVYRKIVSAIRQVDLNHVVILGGAQWDSNFKIFGQPFDSNAIYTFHKYWTAPDIKVINEYLEFRDRYQVPIWLGESGENTYEWIATFTKALEGNHVGWCFWPYKKMDATSSIVTFERPVHWDSIVAFAKLPAGAGNAEKRIAARPSTEEAQEAFDDLLERIQFASSRINSGYVQALGLTPAGH
jgi:endoglucanase